MGFLAVQHCPWKSTPCHLPTASQSLDRKFGVADSLAEFIAKPGRLCNGFRMDVSAFAGQNSIKKARKRGRAQKNEISPPKKTQPDEYDTLSEAENLQNDNTLVSSTVLESPSRSSVLQACTVTSFLIGTLGVIIRQVSHIASTEGLPVTDCSTVLSFSFELWHVGLMIGMVMVVSSLRYLLIMTWPDFAESSEAANRQVLTSLEPSDYIVVAFLPGLTEELLFRGALLPLLGLNWPSVFLVGAVFGILHLGSGRKYSFAVWATFVGFLYGYAAILSSSIIVPMASHAVNNLVGGIIWRYTSRSSKLTE